MTSESLPPAEPENHLSWSEMHEGAPTIIALARICCNAFVAETEVNPNLSAEARTILFAARKNGAIEIKGTNLAFESAERFLAVHIEQDDHQYLAFRKKEDPTLAVQYIDAFRQLCRAGLVLHQLNREFSLTATGFELARSIDQNEVQAMLDHGTII